MTHEPLTASLAGPGIRVWELAHVLAADHAVTIGTPNDSPLRSATVKVRSYRDGGMSRLLGEHSIVVAFGYLLREFPEIRQRARYLVMDLYDPFLLENLLMHDDLPMERREAVHAYDLGVVTDQLRQADFFICASERQRDYWLGALSLVNRVDPKEYAEDPTLRKLLDVVPFGLSSDPPRPNRSAITIETPTIRPDDFVVLWAGGIWNWFDPLTAIRAAARLREEVPELRLYFLGLRHPNPDLPQMEMARQALALAEKLNVLDSHVFFREGWVPYEQRVDYLCSASVGISLHFQHVETRFAFRTRLLDYLWAGLPVISTAGDVLSDEICAGGAGLSVAEGDLDGVIAALRSLARDPGRRQQMRGCAKELAARHTWPLAAEPLAAYCRRPRQSRAKSSIDPNDGTWRPRLHALWQRSKVRRAAGKLRRRLRRGRRQA